MKNKAKLAGLLACALLSLTAAGMAQYPECRYWSGQSAQYWGRGASQFDRGNWAGGGYNYYRGAQALGRAGYFCADPAWGQQRGSIINNPNVWNSQGYWFRSR
jgi:hypothetical protein